MRPFADSPYFIANPLQAQALVRLRHAATYPGSIAVLSGGPGVGKSAFVRQALAVVASDVQLLPVDLRSAEPAEFFDALLHGLGATSIEANSMPVIPRLRQALLAQRTSGRQLIISLDVAGLNVEVARRLLRFVHLCDEQETPVSIVLQGPHTLHELLDVPGLIQLRQRLSYRHRMRPLTLLETSAYLRHGLTGGAASPDEAISPNAAASVYLYVAGVPRLINTLLDAALGEVRARQGSRIDAELIRQIAEQLGWKPLGSRAPAAVSDRAAAPPTQRVVQRLDVPMPKAGAATAPVAERGAPGESTALPTGPSLPAPLVPMDEADTGATGMLRLEDLDERFAETLFSEDSGHFRTLIDAGKAD